MVTKLTRSGSNIVSWMTCSFQGAPAEDGEAKLGRV